jgi:tRNA pseudouridine38-40 synthase
VTTESTDANRLVLALVVSYDGARFVGSQTQPKGRTIQSELDAALARLAGMPVATVFAGRTDAGVHAVGQLVSLPDPRPDLDEATLAKALNAWLPEDLAVLRVERRPAGFHARYDAAWREYRYRLWSGAPQPLARSHCWQRRGLLDWRRMDEAARRFVGERDFAAVAGGGEGVPWSEWRERARGTTRRVIRCSCRRFDPWWGPADGQLLEIQVAADGFLPRMVRTIVALLVEVGEGRREVDRIDEVLAGRDRRLAGGTAPAHGLTLWRVGYAGELPDPDNAVDESD